jgi:protocatechuate 3,4-dioxygenase beta subunit
LLVRGHCVGLESKEGIPYACLDVWQAGLDGKYDYEEKDGKFKPYLSYIGDFNDHSTSKEYDYRSRILADHKGYFEFQTIIPPPYLDVEDDTWRCPHVHFFIQANGHQSVVTQIMFPDMPKNDVDNHIRPELTMMLKKRANYFEANPQFILIPNKK